MVKKPLRQHLRMQSDYELECEAARKARYYRRWSKIALFAIIITLFSPFVSSSPVRVALAATLTPIPNTWTNHSGSATGGPPTSVSRMVEVWDSDHSQLLIHGGLTQLVEPISDTWKLDLGTGAWTQVSVPISVPNRPGGCGIWDTAHHQMLIFGGQNGLPGVSGPLNKVWAFDPVGAGSWKQYDVANPGTDPEPSDGREGVSCVWDPTASKMLIYGGADDVVWAFDPGLATIGTWTELTPISTPFACGRANGSTPGSRAYVSAAWNPTRNSMLMWGGSDTCNQASLNTLNNVWSFSPGNYTTNSGSWTKLIVPNSGITARMGAATVWDTTISQMVIFGGQGTGYNNDVWNFRQTSATDGQWSKRTPLGTAPGPRGYLGAAFTAPFVTQTQTLYFGGDVGNNVPATNDQLWGLGVAPLYGLKFSATIPGFTAGSVVTTGVQINFTDINGNVIPNNTGAPITVTVRVSPVSNNANCGFATNTVNTPPALGCAAAPGGTYTPTVDLHIAQGSTTSTEFVFYSDTLAGSRTVVGEDTGNTSISAVQAVTVAPSAPAFLAFTRQPSTTVIQNVAFTQQPTVSLVDVYSNTVTTASATPITLTLRSQGDVAPPAGAIISGTTTISTTNGVAAFSGLAITKGSSTPYQLKASAFYTPTGQMNALSTNITVNCLAGTSIVTILTDPTLPVADNCQVSLRQAIQNANIAASGSPTQTITFGADLLTTPVTPTLQTLNVTGPALPALAAGVKIDAGCDVITPTVGTRGRPRIAIDGTGITSPAVSQTITAGLMLSNGVTNTGNLVNGLAIVNVPGYGIVVKNSSDHTITCNYIGTDDGISAKPNLLGGIYITNTSAVTLTNRTVNIGLTGSPTSGNLISGNGATGNGAAQIEAKGVGAKTLMFHNFVGYNADRSGRLIGPPAAPNTGGPVLKYTGRARVTLKQGNWLKR